MIHHSQTAKKSADRIHLNHDGAHDDLGKYHYAQLPLTIQYGHDGGIQFKTTRRQSGRQEERRDIGRVERLRYRDSRHLPKTDKIEIEKRIYRRTI